MNASASEFVPSWMKPAQQAPPVTSTPPTQKDEEKDSWEDKMETSPSSPSVKTVTDKVEVLKLDEKDPTFSPSDEQIRKEVKSIAKELGVSEEDLLNDKVAEEVFAVEKDDAREHLNIVFIGHVDAGKSTIAGSILYHTGMVDERTIQKYEKEAKENNRESWFLAYIMDTNEEERAKGKTVEVGSADFETKNKRYTILDAPGHKNYVPNMIGGASQADIGILVISAKKGEFESGFTKGGQTKEHAMLAKTLGLKYLIVVINKMDDGTVEWSKERYDEIQNTLNPFLRQCGFNIKDVIYLPISGLKGTNLKDRLTKDICSWYDGGSLLETLDTLKPIDRLSSAPLRMPIIDKYRDRGAVVIRGKIEAGSISKGDSLCIVPNKTPVEVLGVFTSDTTAVKTAKAGENVRVLIKGVEEENIHRGFVLSDKIKVIPCQAKFEAQLAIMELLPHKSIFSAGYTAVIHIHTAVEECTVTVLVAQIDKKTNQVLKKRPQFVKNGALVNCIIECNQNIPLELFSDIPQLGRFTLRDEGKTIAVGKVIALGPKKKTT